MSQFQEAKPHFGSRPPGRVYEPTRVAAPIGSYPFAVTPDVMTVTQLDFGNSQYGSTATYETQLSEEEIVLLREKETLTKAVEALKLKRQAVAAALRKTEEEVSRLAREAEARNHATKEALLLAEAQRRQLQAEEAVLRQAPQVLPQPGVKLEPAREPAPSEIPPADAKTPMHLHDRLRELALQERLRTEQHDGGATNDRLRIAEPPSRSKPLLETKEQASLEQRLRAEIEGLAAAQKRSVDAARAQVRLHRSNPAQAQTAL